MTGAKEIEKLVAVSVEDYRKLQYNFIQLKLLLSLKNPQIQNPNTKI